jgi:Fe2+ transport system protein FeoA
MSPADRGRAAGAVALSSLPEGRRARLVTVEGGAGLRTRLVAMGLRAGAQLRVVHNGGRGPFVLAIDDCRMVLGRGMANRILVEPVKERAPAAK